MVAFGDVAALADAVLEVAGWGREASDRIRGFVAARFSEEQVIGGFLDYVARRVGQPAGSGDRFRAGSRGERG
jgi:hypothetical protein